MTFSGPGESVEQPFTAAAGTTPEEVAALVGTWGVARLPGWADRARTHDATVECRSLLASRSPLVEHEEYGLGTFARVLREYLPELGCPAVSELFGEAWLRQVAQLLRPGGHRFNHVVITVHDVAGSRHFAHDPHYDRRPHLKFFLHLSEVGPENGPIFVVPGQQWIAQQAERDNRAQGRLPELEHTRDLPDDLAAKGVPICGPAGTLLVMTSDLPHRATLVTAGERLAVRSRSFPPDVSPGLSPDA